MVERPRRLADERVRLVEQCDVRLAPPGTAASQEPLLGVVENALGRLGQEGRCREQRADEAVRGNGGPGAIEDAAELAARPERPLDLLRVAHRAALEETAVLGVEAPHESHPEALARSGRRAVLRTHVVEELHLVADADTDERPVEAEEQLVGLASEADLGGAGDHVGHPLVSLQTHDVARLARGRLDAVDELRDRTLLDGVLSERGKDVRDVLHEDAVRPHDQDAAPRASLARRVEEPRGAVEPDRGLARPGAALDHERVVGRST